MRIAKIYVPEKVTKKINLEKIDLTIRPLGSTVALVGKNGGGKSRILSFVENYMNILTPEDILNDHIQYIPSEVMGPHLRNFNKAKSIFRKLSNQSLNEQQIDQNRVQANKLVSPVHKNIRQLSNRYIKVVDNDALKIIKENVNRNDGFSFEEILNNKHIGNQTQQGNKAKRVLLNEFTEFNTQSTINYLTNLTNEIAIDEFNLYLKNRETPEFVNPEIKKKKSYQLFSIFQENVKKFLGKDFSYQQTVQGNTVNSTLHFDNQPFNLNFFSPGQKTLFAYAILFFFLEVNSKTNIRDSIILLDEPEKHLHPEAQIALVDALKSIVANSGQLWIATHSVHILSHLEYDEILMVKDSKIIPPSRTTPGESFNDLMGLENHIAELISLALF